MRSHIVGHHLRAEGTLVEPRRKGWPGDVGSVMTFRHSPDVYALRPRRRHRMLRGEAPGGDETCGTGG